MKRQPLNAVERQRLEAQRLRILQTQQPILAGLSLVVFLTSAVAVGLGQAPAGALAWPFAFTAVTVLLWQIDERTDLARWTEGARLTLGPVMIAFHPYVELSPMTPWLYYLATSITSFSVNFFFTRNRALSYLLLAYWTICYIVHAIAWRLDGRWFEHGARSAYIFALGALLIEITRYLQGTFDDEYRAKLQAFGASKLSALGEMAGGIAHEINNPLAVVKNVTSQIQDVLGDPAPDRELLSEMTRTVEQSVERMWRIAQGMRNVSHEDGQDPAKPVEVKRLVQETLEFCREKLKLRGVQLTSEDVPADLRFEGRFVEMSQVLINLVNNACDAVQGKEKPWVRISAQEAQGHVEIRVEDSGAGVPKELRQSIFQPFFTTKEIGKGTGLGLSISQTIVQNLEGSLSIDASRPCSCFLIRLPIRQRTVKAA